ncbi:hypothetical protein AHAT_41960 [Agarivorans sp. Toyoura001]|nr:hypothetical protein AHAT_41960 [Agarivorans sp. Toyoura001]
MGKGATTFTNGKPSRQQLCDSRSEKPTSFADLVIVRYKKGVTLSVTPFLIWWPFTDLNCGPNDYESDLGVF